MTYRETNLYRMTHDLVNLRVYPTCVYRLGQSEDFDLADAKVVCERTGNAVHAPKEALTYRYNIDGPGFSAQFWVLWDNADAATSRDIYMLTVTPDDEEAHEAFEVWLSDEVMSNHTPRDMFAGRVPFGLSV